MDSQQAMSARRRLWATRLLAALGLAYIPIMWLHNPAQAAGDIGYRDFSFSAADVTAPTGEKPQSKLWFNDGLWWGSLFNRTAEKYHIYRFDRAKQTWSDTGTVIDDRNSSKADVLWDGSRLYIASASPTSTSSAASARLLRFSYNASTKRYTLDAGFPVVVNNGGVEAIVLAKDTKGKLWVTYTQNSKVYVNRSIGSDTTWGTPFVLPVKGTSVSADDISAVIAFRGNIGVMWSNQIDSAVYFATHRDGDPDSSWQAARTALQGPKEADDHINLKAMQADASGQIFAIVKTARNEEANPNPNAPLIRLLVLRTDNTWTNYVFGRVADDHTRPVVMIDRTNRQLYVFATAPETGGAIYYKKTSLDTISFAAGRGTPFIQRSTDTRINNATSTKQNLTSTSGLLVLASDTSSGYYVHNMIGLGTPPTPTRTPLPSPTPTLTPGGYANRLLATTGLVSYWRLGETGGATVDDAKGANNGGLNGGVSLGIAGAINNDANTAMAFDGSSGVVSVANHASLNITGTLSIEAWVKPDTVDSQSRTILIKESGGSTSVRQYRLGMTTLGDGVPRWRGAIYIGSTSYGVSSSTRPVAGSWYHLALVRNGSTLTLYVNGVAESSVSVPASGQINSTAGALTLGQSTAANTPQPFAGTIDEVAVYRTALTAAQILDRVRAAE
jgi:hypothetical protein